MMMFIGGIGAFWGPVLGAVLMTPLGEFLRSYLGALQQGLNFFIYGLVLIGVVMVLPGGIVSPILSFIRHRDFKARQVSSGKEAL